MYQLQSRRFILCIIGLFCFFTKANSQSFSQPLLVYPVNEDTIFTPYPVFSWIAANGSNWQNVSSSIKITEILQGQSAVAAIQANPTWVESHNLNSFSFYYPLSARNLESGKQYAWQVTSKIVSSQEGSNNNDLASEVYTFVYSTEIPPNQCFPLIIDKQGIDEFLFVENKKLFFNTDSVYQVDKNVLEFKLSNIKGEIIANNVYPVKLSGNILMIDLNQFREFRADKNKRKFYRIIAVANNRKYTLKFTFE